MVVLSRGPPEYTYPMVRAVLEHWDQISAIAEDDFNEALIAIRVDIEVRIAQAPGASGIIARTMQLAGGAAETIRISAATKDETAHSIYDLLRVLNVEGLR